MILKTVSEGLYAGNMEPAATGDTEEFRRKKQQRSTDKQAVAEMMRTLSVLNLLAV